MPASLAPTLLPPQVVAPTPSGWPSYPLRLASYGGILSLIFSYIFLPPEGPTLKATGPGKEGLQ